MTPAASAAAGTRARRSAGAATIPRRVAPQRPRRVSGPARPARHAAPAIALAPPLGARLVRGAGQLVDHRLLDRLIRGRAWIGLVAFALIGIVAMQVALLKLNTGIGRSIERASALQQQNTALEAQISTLASGDRITTAAASIGMVYPPAGDVGYLSVSPGDALRASRAFAAGLAQPLAPSALSAASAAGTGATSSILTPAISNNSAIANAASSPASATVTAASGAASSGAAATAAAGSATVPSSTAAPASAGSSGSAATPSSSGATSAAAPPSAGAASGGAAAGTGTGTAASAAAGGGSPAATAGAAAYPGSTGRR